MGKPITEEQKSVLDTLVVERLSSNPANKALIAGIQNIRNNQLVTKLLLPQTWKEDADNVVAYYLVKTKTGRVLSFFALRCGEVFRSVDEELIRAAEEYKRDIQVIKDPASSPEEWKKSRQNLLNASANGWSLDRIEEYSKKALFRKKDLSLDKNIDNHHVAEAYSSIELAIFCNNDDKEVKEEWDSYGILHRRGVVCFWYIIMPRIEKMMKYVGCEYLYLFAADDDPDGTLVNHYKAQMYFQSPVKLGANKPSYDYACVFLCQKINELIKQKKEFFNNFNEDISDAI